MRNLMLSLTDQGTQLLAIGVRILDDEFFQHGIVARDQAITPAFEIVETLVVLASGGIKLIEQGQNRVSVLIAHQFADELQVPFTRDVRGVLGRIGQSPAHSVGQRQFCDQVWLECCQALAEVNQSMQLAFDLRFAFSPVSRSRRKNQPWWQSAKKRRHDNQSGPLVRPGRSMTPAESRI